MSKMVDVASVMVEGRHRKDMGDLQSLADSMVAIGQLQEIGIDKDSRLIFGERRLRAAELAGWAMIRAKIVNLADILRAEHDENEIRKDFNLDERVAILETLEQHHEKRQGQRTELPAPGPEVTPGEETRETVAKLAGFGSEQSARRAKAVFGKDADTAPELRDAVNSKTIGVKEGAEIAQAVPKSEQAEVVSLDKARRKVELAKKKTLGKVKVESDLTPEVRAKHGRFFPVWFHLDWCMRGLIKEERIKTKDWRAMGRALAMDQTHADDIGSLDEFDKTIFEIVREYDRIKSMRKSNVS